MVDPRAWILGPCGCSLLQSREIGATVTAAVTDINQNYLRIPLNKSHEISRMRTEDVYCLPCVHRRVCLKLTLQALSKPLSA